ncbi:MAG: ComEC/Rec2 family competence protein [Candidatus Omnitrophica bacterium]|nr:ComEC/Rec2 family competence protein [Candidatus Omnitrophota bacterium]
MKRPLVTAAAFYVFGILLAVFLQVPWPWLFAVAIPLAGTTLAWSRAQPVLLGFLLIMAGWANLAWRTAILSPYDLRRVSGARTELATLRGTLCGTPVRRVYERGQRITERSQAEIDVWAIRRQSSWQRAAGRVAISTPGVLGAEFFEGRSVEVEGVLGPPASPVAEGLFDYRRYLQWRGIYYQLKADSTNDWQLVPDPQSPDVPPLADRFCRWAQETLARGLPAEDEALRLSWAMALGWKTGLTGEVSQPFMRTGTMHIFAISGLHIAMIAGILVSLLRVGRMPRGACGWIVIPSIWFYTAATGWQPSAIRSTLMMSIVIAGWALKRPSDLLNSLAAAGFLILLWEPRQLFQASFQLSFLVVMSIALVLPPLERARQRLLQTDPFLPAELRPGWSRRLDSPLRFVTMSFATSLAAWIGSMPLIAYYFHLVTPISLLANLLIVPLSSLALMCNLGSLICGSWLAPVSVLFNHAGWFWMEIMVRLSEWMSTLPGSFFYVPAPGAFEFAAYYAVLGVALTGWLFVPRRRYWATGIVGVLAGLCAWHAIAQMGRIRLTVLAVGGGDSIYVDAPGRSHDLLVDAGNASSAEFVVKPFLKARGVNWLPPCLLTHGDLRHVGGLPIVAAEFAGCEIVTSPVRFRSSAYRRLVADWEQAKRSCRRIKRGDRIGAWVVLYPSAKGDFSLADDNAMVLRGELPGLRLLLCSDLGEAGQSALLDYGEDLRADILITGIPSKGEPLSDSLVDAVRPRVIIVSTANSPVNEQASEELRQRLERRGIPVIYTSVAGSVTLEANHTRWQLRSMKGTILSVPVVAGTHS